MPLPQREIFWNVPPSVLLAVYLLSGICFAWIVFWFAKRARVWKKGRPADQQLGWLEGLPRLAVDLLTHRTIRRDRYARLMHALIFWGFAGLLLATTLVAIQHHTDIVFLTGLTYRVFSLGADLAGIAFCGGLVMAIWRRRKKTSDIRLLPSHQTTGMLWLMLVLGLTGFLVEGARIAQDFPSFEIWSPAGYATAKSLAALGIQGESVTSLHRCAWISHAILVMVFLAIVPLTMIRHVVLGAYSVVRSPRRPGVLTPVAPSVIAIDLADFGRLDLLQADACLTCGLCTTVCPAEAAGKPLSPRTVVLGLRDHLNRPDVSLAEQVADDALWSCITCNACDVICPVHIDIVEKIVNLRWGRVAQGAIPDAAIDALESASQKLNPFGQANSGRMEWARGLDVPVAEQGEQFELLYWIGCGGAFEPAGQEVSQAMIRILNQLNVKYRVLGCRERCTGDPVRRLGEETLWQELAAMNLETIAGHRVKTILTHCPHCFNPFRNEYPSLGPMPHVVHHSQWLRDKLNDGTLHVRSAAETVTFHDPCYLSRANNEVTSPRTVLDAIFSNHRVEMQQHGQNGFCCGGAAGKCGSTFEAKHASRTFARLTSNTPARRRSRQPARFVV